MLFSLADVLSDRIVGNRSLASLSVWIAGKLQINPFATVHVCGAVEAILHFDHRLGPQIFN